MKIDLSDKTALVSGSTAGIGYAIAKGLAAAGAKVVINGRKPETVEKAAAALNAEIGSNRVRGVAADLSTAAGCDQLVKGAGPVDILVNNAGIFEPKPFFDIPDSDWTRFFEINVMSGVRLSRALMPGMLEKNWGRILFISSESALNIPKEMIHYGFTKTGQLSVARGLAQMTVGTGVTVNSILPGPTRSDGVETFLEAMARENKTTTDAMASNFVKEFRPSSLIQRFATVEEVANMVVYISSKEASATNGAALRVEGGVLSSIA
jgi:NAD(P)-dependent dehydrogenase (short-subunit alcohol dehydrogenase family)